MRMLAAAGLAALGLVAWSAADSAQAYCWWNGYYWRCEGQGYDYPACHGACGGYGPAWYEARPIIPPPFSPGPPPDIGFWSTAP